MLRSDERPTLINTREARVHAYLRLQQGYRAREVVRELSLLRITLLDYLTASLAEQSLSMDIDAYSKTARIINFYIDEELSYAISVCSEADEPDTSAPDTSEPHTGEPDK